ncbi:MAG: hypothetical protein ACPGWR_14635 [Ardenticatenaceae bacterium]
MTVQAIFAVGVIVMPGVVAVAALAVSFYREIAANRQKEPEIVIKRGPRPVAISQLNSKELEKLIHDMEQIKLQILSLETEAHARAPRPVAISQLNSKELEKVIHDIEQIKLQILSLERKAHAS